MHYRKYIITAILIPVTAYAVQSQVFNWELRYHGFFDNREYFNKYTIDQTIFGSRISGELGCSFNENNRIMAGADYLYEFGSKGEWIAPDVTFRLLQWEMEKPELLPWRLSKGR
jgi:hypothetical protein